MLKASQVTGVIRDDGTHCDVQYRLDFTLKAKTYVFCNGRLSSTNRDLSGDIEEFHVVEVMSISAAEAMADALAKKALVEMVTRRERS